MTAPRLVVAIAVAATLTVLLTMQVAPAAKTTPTRTCFPAAKWNTGTVPASKRPCARIVRVFEDGSVRIRVEDASGSLRYGAGIGARDR